jgi:hypothetical protein
LTFSFRLKREKKSAYFCGEGGAAEVGVAIAFGGRGHGLSRSLPYEIQRKEEKKKDEAFFFLCFFWLEIFLVSVFI